MNLSLSIRAKRILVGLLVIEGVVALRLWHSRAAPTARDNTIETQSAERFPEPSRRTSASAPKVNPDVLRELVPELPGASPWVAVGERLDADGVPMSLASFETEADAPAVLAFYARAFEARGWPWWGPAHTSQSVPYPALAATLPERGLELTVMVLASGDHAATTVIVGVADVAGAGKIPPPDDLPAYPESKPLTLRAHDPGSEGLAVSYEAADAPEQVERYLRTQAERRGLRIDAAASGAAGSTSRELRLASPERRWLVTISPRGKGSAILALAAGEESP